MSSTITLREYLDKNKRFVIPAYQRGYVWGKKAGVGQKTDAVTHLMDTLLQGFQEKRKVFVQGITVSEGEQEIEIIDGQQRTTFFYLLLKVLGCPREMQIVYRVRKESQAFLENIVPSQHYEAPSRDEPYQDIYFFKRSLHTMQEKLSEKEKEGSFCDYLLDKVRFLYIEIPAKQASSTFSMMNGSKAQMLPEELIKAELLRLVSLCPVQRDEAEIYAREWEVQALRSRYAREWDKWLQWWRREEVQEWCSASALRPLGWLLPSFYQQQAKKENFGFSSFRQTFMKRQNATEAKNTFEQLRKLQKRFEDAFHDAKTYNYVGAILRLMSKDDQSKFVQWYFLGEKPAEGALRAYYLLAFLGLTYTEIIERNKKKLQEKYKHRLKEIESNELYHAHAEAAYRLLLRLNIDEDNQQENGSGRKFDFSIWSNRSLEHIYPKSKVVHQGEDGRLLNGSNEEVVPDDTFINRENCKEEDDDEAASEHSIGNLVLLYKDENSKFSNRSFDKKKALFFKKGGKGKELFKSRHLLHTIYAFATSQWKGEDIARHKKQTIAAFKSTYEKLIADA